MTFKHGLSFYTNLTQAIHQKRIELGPYLCAHLRSGNVIVPRETAVF